MGFTNNICLPITETGGIKIIRKMSLYAIGDLHLHYQSILRAPGQLHDRVWKNHEEKFQKNCGKTVTDKDTLVLVGDHSWGKSLAECELDFQFICDLPGRKVLIRGNHDMFWDRRGQIMGWNEEAEEHAKKLVERELQRLRKSFELAKADGYRKFIMFLHYPPTNILEERSGFTDMAEEYGAEQVIYAHCHGESRFHDSIHGEYRGRTYHLVSGDYLRWKPLKILN